jgi:hypothetical protein
MAMLFPNDLNKDPRQNKHVRSPRARRALGLFSRALFAILSTAVGQKGPVTVSAGSRTSSNPAVAGWSSFVGKRRSFLFSFFFLFVATYFSGPISAIWRQKMKLEILFFIEVSRFLKCKNSRKKIAKIWKKKNQKIEKLVEFALNFFPIFPIFPIFC